MRLVEEPLQLAQLLQRKVGARSPLLAAPAHGSVGGLVVCFWVEKKVNASFMLTHFLLSRATRLAQVATLESLVAFFLG